MSDFDLMGDVYAMWVPLALSASLIGLGATLGWMLRGWCGR